MSNIRCLIVGASHAGAQLSLVLRQGGFAGRIVLVGDEAAAPCQRPPLFRDLPSSAREIPIKPLLENPS